MASKALRFVHDGRRYDFPSVAAACVHFGIKRRTVEDRRDRGLSWAEALTRPLGVEPARSQPTTREQVQLLRAELVELRARLARLEDSRAAA